VFADPARLAAVESRAKRELDVADQVRATNDQSRFRLYWRLVLSHAGVQAEPERLAPALAELESYHERWNLWETVLPGVPETLEQLRAAGFRLVVVSNSNGTLRAKLRNVDLDRRVDIVIDSHEVGVEKPDARIFHLAMERAGIGPAEALHVGDLYEVDVVGARGAGLRAVLVDPLDLYPGSDCERFASLPALAEALLQSPRKGTLS
jgi:HAD superfamily hydrolase (TIGR01509 family)